MSKQFVSQEEISHKELGELLKSLEESGYDFTLSDFAELLNVSFTTAYRWSVGQSEPRGNNKVNFEWIVGYGNPENFILKTEQIPRDPEILRKTAEFRQVIGRKRAATVTPLYDDKQDPCCSLVYELDQIGEETGRWSFAIKMINDKLQPWEQWKAGIGKQPTLTNAEIMTLYKGRALSVWSKQGQNMTQEEIDGFLLDLDSAIEYAATDDERALTEQNKCLYFADFNQLDKAISLILGWRNRVLADKTQYALADNLLCLGCISKDVEIIKDAVQWMGTLGADDESREWRQLISTSLDRDADKAFLREEHPDIYDEVKKNLNGTKKLDILNAGFAGLTMLFILVVTALFIGLASFAPVSYTQSSQSAQQQSPQIVSMNKTLRVLV